MNMADLSTAFNPSIVATASDAASNAASKATIAQSMASDASSAAVVAAAAASGWTPTHMVTAWLDGDQNNITAGGSVLVALDTEIMDIGNDFSTATHLFTVPHTGYYFVIGSIGWKPQVISKLYYVQIGATGGGNLCQANYRTTSATTYFTINTSKIVYLEASDTVGLYALNDSGDNTSDLNGTVNNTYLSIVYLG